MELDLQPFCGTDIFRDYLNKPFSHGEFTYATNGHIMVRLPRRPDVPDNQKKANWDGPFKGLDLATFAALRHRPLPAIPEPREEDCSECEGRGHEHDCPDCSCTCETCNGSGKEKVAAEISTTIRGGLFNLRYIIMAVALPGIEFMANKRDHEAPLLFRFDGGVGAIMPRRSKCDEHVEVEMKDAA